MRARLRASAETMTWIGASSLPACCWAACATCASVGSTVGTADGGTATVDSGAAGVAEVGAGAPPAGGAPTGACCVVDFVAELVGLAVFLTGLFVERFGTCLMTTR